MHSNKKIEKELTEKINNLLKKDSLDLYEKKILYKFLKKKDKSFLRRVKELKNELRKIQLEKGLEDGLSDELLDLYTYLERYIPTTGPSSIFNGLIK